MTVCAVGLGTLWLFVAAISWARRDSTWLMELPSLPGVCMCSQNDNDWSCRCSVSKILLHALKVCMLNVVLKKVCV